MSVKLKTHKLLWGASGNTCAKCKALLVEDATLTDDPSLVGEEAHIISKKPDGPRYNDPLPIDKRDLLENLILLCNRCHKIVDDQENTYTADFLRQMKKKHEESVRETLSSDDTAKSRDDLTYAEYIEEWELCLQLDYWNAWTSYLLSADAPRTETAHRDRLTQLNMYLLNRVWPERYTDLEQAFKTFGHVMNDLLREFGRHSICQGENDEMVVTEKFYKTSGYLEQEDYNRRVDAYEFHTDVIRDLTLELTRIANYICDLIRQYLSPAYRLQDGRLTVTMGPLYDFSLLTFVPEYSSQERTGIPYHSLQNFLENRINRDYAAGRGTEPGSKQESD